MEMTKLCQLLKDKGIVGAGGAGFPTYAKMNEKADTLILNCAECEPLLKLHRQLLRDHAEEIVKAFREIAVTLGVSQAIIGVKEEYQTTIEALEAVLPNDPLLRIHKLPGAYPMGDEVVLIYEATGRVVRPGGLPIECGVVVLNVETVYNASQALYHNLPVTTKLVTVCGEVTNPKTVRVPIGMQLKDVVAMAGEITTKNPIYLIGGPMMGNFGSQYQSVTKTTSAIIVLPETHPIYLRKNTRFSIAVTRAASACCQCQTCTDLCPRHALGHPIEPHLFMRQAANRDVSNIEPFINTMFCSSCGLCEMYSCPQGLSPRSMMASYKAELRKNGIKPISTEAVGVSPMREYRKAPEERLLSRLGLQKYDKPCEIDESIPSIKKVKISLSQHIGAPAVAEVAVGDVVQSNQRIAHAAEGLSVCIHASISGRVTEVTEKEIVIEES